MYNIERFEYVSFDIFDTLIKRNVEKPEDVFMFVEKKLLKYNICDFKKLRMEAQHEARMKSTSMEITLDEIYDNINLSENDRRIAQRCEIDTEIEICQFNKRISKIYNEAINKKKKIVIISDMYLEEDIIIRILDKCKISYDYLFVSSKIKKTKSNGQIYKYVLNKLNIRSNQILHIGDNIKSDFINSRLNGIKSVLYQEKKDISYYDINDASIEYNILKTFIYNNCISESYYYKLGYEALGPLLFGFCKWLKSNIGKNKIYFLSRDGKIVKEAYERMFEKNDTTYLYASRRSTIVPSLWKYKSIIEMTNIMQIGRRCTVEKLLNKVGIESIDSSSIYNNYHIDVKKEFLTEDLKNNQKLLNFLNTYIGEIKKISKNEYEQLLKYYKDINFSDDACIVDIGWNGNIQNAISKLFPNKKIKGYYVGLNPDNIYQDSQEMKGYLFDKNNNKDLYEKEKYFNLIFEFMFMTTHGSVKRFVNYNENNSYVQFEKYEYENSIEEKYLEEIQKGAIDFVIDFKTNGIDKYEIINQNNSYLNIFKKGINPTLKDIRKLGAIRFEGKKRIVEKKTIFNYVFNLKSFIRDYKDSSWRIGFLRNIIIIPIDYYKLNEKIRKKYINNNL